MTKFDWEKIKKEVELFRKLGKSHVKNEWIYEAFLDLHERIKKIEELPIMISPFHLLKDDKKKDKK